MTTSERHHPSHPSSRMQACKTSATLRSSGCPRSPPHPLGSLPPPLMVLPTACAPDLDGMDSVHLSCVSHASKPRALLPFGFWVEVLLRSHQARVIATSLAAGSNGSAASHHEQRSSLVGHRARCWFAGHRLCTTGLGSLRIGRQCKPTSRSENPRSPGSLRTLSAAQLCSRAPLVAS